MCAILWPEHCGFISILFSRQSNSKQIKNKKTNNLFMTENE